MNAVILLALLAATVANYGVNAEADAKAKSSPLLVRPNGLDSTILHNHHETKTIAHKTPLLGHGAFPIGISHHQGHTAVHSSPDYSYLSAQAPGLSYPGYAPSYDINDYAHQTPGYGYQTPGYGYQTPGYGYSGLPLYNQQIAGVTGAVGGVGVTGAVGGVGIGGVGIGVPAVGQQIGGVYGYGVAPSAYGYGYDSLQGQGVVTPFLGGTTLGSTYSHNSIGSVLNHGTVASPFYGGNNVYQQYGYSVPSPLFGQHLGGPIYSPDVSLSYAPHSFSPIIRHKGTEETHTVVKEYE